jgi:hypothetical protein
MTPTHTCTILSLYAFLWLTHLFSVYFGRVIHQSLEAKCELPYKVKDLEMGMLFWNMVDPMQSQESL